MQPKSKFSVNFPGKLIDEKLLSWWNASIDFIVSNQSLIRTFEADKIKFSPKATDDLTLHSINSSHYESNGTKEEDEVIFKNGKWVYKQWPLVQPLPYLKAQAN